MKQRQTLSHFSHLFAHRMQMCTSQLLAIMSRSVLIILTNQQNIF